MVQLESSTHSYKGPAHEVRTYLVRPAGESLLPGLILVHEIWGLNEHVRDVADRFAKEGYVVAAPDLMGSDPSLAPMFTPDAVEAVTKVVFGAPPERRRDPDYMQQQIAALPPELSAKVGTFYANVFGGRLPCQRFADELVLACDFLKKQRGVNPEKVGSIGFCFGGAMSLRLACTGKTQACVVFYGQNPDPLDQVEKISCPVLGNYGGEDVMLNASLDKLVASMVRYRKDFGMRIYPGAPHAFFNDTNPFAYRPAAAREAWETTLRFLQRALK